MTDTREIELELRGRSCFVAALESHDVAPTLANATTLEKEKILLSVVGSAHELLEASLLEGGEYLSPDERLLVDRGISFACEEWLRTPEDRQLVGV